MITEILYAVLIFYVISIFGIKIFRLFNSKLDFYEELIFSIALGFGISGNIILILGLLGLLYKELFLFIIISLGIIFIPELKRLLKEFQKPKIKFNWIIVLIILFLLFNFIGALAPPTGWDTQKYHLSCQESYLENHKITYVPILHCDLPSLANMFILLGMILKNDILAKLIFYLVFLVLVFSVYIFSKKYFGEKVAELSILIFVSLPNIIYYASTVHTDMFLSLFTIISIFSFYYWIKEENIKWAILSAILIGFVFATKITGIIIIIIFVILFLIKFLSSANKKKIFLHGLIFFFTISFIIGIWFFKAFLFTGNPVYPIGYNVIGGIQNLSYGTEYTTMQLNSGEYEKTIKDYILSPFQITANGYKFFSSFSLSPLFLLFIPILFFIKKNNLLKYLIFFCFIYYTIWFFLHPYLMKLIPILSILSIITSYAILEGINKKYLFRFMWLFLIFGFIFSLAMSGLIYKNQIKVALNLETREDYLSKNLDMFETFNYTNNNLNQTDKILLIGEERNYYLEINFQEGDPTRQGLIDYRNINLNELKNWLEKENINYLIINKNYFAEVNDSELNLYGWTEYSYELINNFTKENCKEIFVKNNVWLYKID
jgi:hypothetical protein